MRTMDRRGEGGHRGRIAQALGVLLAVSVLAGCGSAGGSAAPYEATPVTEPFASEIYVEAIPGLSGRFLKGMDISSIIAEEESGVKYYDADGTERDLFHLLADAGVNLIRVRVWNDPYDEDGNGYGGGNCDAAKAAEIGKRAAAAGMPLLVDFHYSDFWADPTKQMVPKAWKGMTSTEKADAVYTFTKESLEQIVKAGADIWGVQIGNEINYGIAGERSDEVMMKLLKRGAEAVREVDANFRITVHFAGVDDPNFIAKKAAWLTEEGLDYDVFGVSYYPFWHGSLKNLKKVLTQAKETTGKDVMIVETSFPYTKEDGDFSGNSAGDADELGNYYVSEQGQAQAMRDVCAAAAEVDALGVCYWESAWVPVPGATKSEKQALWESKGSGWASSYAAAYDPNDAGKYYGGSSWDNQAFFDFDGKRLASLDVWNGISVGTISGADPMSGYCADPNAVSAAEVESLLENCGFEEADLSMWEVTYEGKTDPTDRQTKEADAKSGENAFHFWSANAVDFTVQQTIAAPEDGVYFASAALQGGDVGSSAEIYLYASVNGVEYRSDPVELTGWVNWKEPAIEGIEAAAGDEITVGVAVKCSPGGWGTIDDIVLLKD